uniref:C-type lectin n=1 Tax=Rhabditophanes sp. KR3021 TaxID=114890 RepID=A0AC35UCS5_9BILA
MQAIIFSFILFSTICAFPFEQVGNGVSPFKSFGNGAYPLENLCSEDIKGLYVDIVFVIDTSKGAGKFEFNGQKAIIKSFIHTGFSISQLIPQATRVAYMTAGEITAKLQNPLSAFNSVNEAHAALKDIEFDPNGGKDINIGVALMAAETELLTNIRDKSKNKNYKKVIILFTSESNVDCSDHDSLSSSDVCRSAANIKAEGIDIITIRLNFEGTHPLVAKGIASPCASFDNDNNMLSNMKGRVLKANCYCEGTLVQYTRANDECFKSADCIQYEASSVPYLSALENAENLNAALLTIRTPEKQLFVQGMCGDRLPMHIGLNEIKNGTDWTWVSGADVKDGFQNFAPNVISKVGACAYMDKGGKWRDEACSYSEDSLPYAYEMKACSASNFCI